MKSVRKLCVYHVLLRNMEAAADERKCFQSTPVEKRRPSAAKRRYERVKDGGVVGMLQGM